jgi:hypothetical protein
MAEELALPDRCDGALFPVHPELEFSFQKPRDRVHHALSGGPRSHVNVAIIGVAAEAMSPAVE